MKVIGVTGGVGAGKSTVLAYLQETYGAYVIQADQVGHWLMAPGGSCYKPVISLFGKEILKEDQTIDRRRISDMVFSAGELLEKLNAIIHPAVKAYICREIEQKKEEGCSLCIVEAALLLEDHYDEICDEIWYIYADKETRIERLMENRGYTREKSEEIIRKQAAEEFFRVHTDYELDNSGTWERTRKQIREGISRYETL